MVLYGLYGAAGWGAGKNCVVSQERPCRPIVCGRRVGSRASCLVTRRRAGKGVDSSLSGRLAAFSQEFSHHGLDAAVADDLEHIP